jgi:hypothetical protein
MGGCASAKTREIKIAAMERLIRKYNVNLCLFMKLNYNWSKVYSSANLASWFQDKTLGIYDAPAGGNEGHLNHIKSKATTWVNRMTNGYLLSHIAWVGYRHQLWPGLRYGLGTMTNDIEPAAKLLDDVDCKHSMYSGYYTM